MAFAEGMAVCPVGSLHLSVIGSKNVYNEF